MSVSGVKVDPALGARTYPAAESLERFSVGQRLSVRVLERLGEREYLAAIGARTHRVDSLANLQPGTTARVMVTEVTDRLTLRYLGDEPELDSSVGGAQDEQALAQAPLDQLLARFRLDLSPVERRNLEDLSNVSSFESQPRLLAGLFLHKLGLPIGDAAVRAVAGALVREPGTAMGSGPSPLAFARLELPTASELQSSEAIVQRLAELLRQADASASLDPSDDTSTADERVEEPSTSAASPWAADGVEGVLSSPEREMRERQDGSRWLNVPDQGEVAYRYASLPLLVDGELVELDVALFRATHAWEGKPKVQRLVVTLATRRFGALQILLQSVDERLSIAFSGERVQVPEVLGARTREVQKLAHDLGWHVDAVRYEIQPQQVRAAHHIVDHVLANGTVDRHW